MTMIASNRVEGMVRVVVDAARKAAKEAITELENRKVLNEKNFQRILAQGDKVTERVKMVVAELMAELAENIVGRLKLVSGGKSVKLTATEGRETLTNARDVFTGYIDPDFKNWGLDVVSEPTKEMEVAVYEMIKDGNFAQLFGGFGENLDRLCLTQAQIRVFVRDQKNWLRTEGYGTFFLFKVGTEFFVAFVSVHAGGSDVRVLRFSLGSVWIARYELRVVVPQLIFSPLSRSMALGGVFVPSPFSTRQAFVPLLPIHWRGLRIFQS